MSARKKVIFGIGKIGEVVHDLMKHEAGIDVAGWAVDRRYATVEQKEGLPVVPFDELVAKFPPATHDLFVAVGYHDMNAVRSRTMEAARAMGYAMPAFIHPASGLPQGTPVGENAFIMRDVLIHPRASIGADVFVWSGAIVGHHSVVGDHCWITSGANIAGACGIGDHCFLAINCTIGNSIRIGRRCFIGANALVVKDLADEQVVIAAPDKPLRLNTDQFLRMSNFTSL
jgi:sugar O-acyltransferase (sialic acid O-acetyltransferase NeuD family)